MSRKGDPPAWAHLPTWLHDYERSRAAPTVHVVREEDRTDLDTA